MPRGSGRSAKRAAALEALKAGDDDVLRPPVAEQVTAGFVVRQVSGASGKAYRCPGCDQQVRPATPHVVAWPEGRPDDRRHWHSACWSARDRRGVKVQRSKNAPRYG